jgi:uncharacterized protein (TIGR02466 family)
MEILEIFPDIISTHIIEEKYLNKILDSKHIENLMVNDKNYISEEKYLLDNIEYKHLKAKIEELLNKHFLKVCSPINKDLHVYITQSWINVTNKGESHHLHNHANSMFSGVLYIEVRDSDSIIFMKNNARASILSLEVTNTRLNSTEWPVNSLRKGGVVILPSKLMNMVPPVEYEGNRVSIGFNTFIKGDTGGYRAAIQLIL